jgi:transposase-like protein
MCGSKAVYFDRSRNGWECKTRHPQRKFTLKTGTIFEDSPLGFDKWLPAVWMIANCKNGVSSWELHRAIGVTQKTAWFMLQRIRLAMQDEDTGGKLSGDVEVDETFIGGKARNMHVAQRRRRITGTGGKDKTAVMGILQRGGKVRTMVVDNRRKATLQAEINKHVEAGAALYTDELLSYDGLEGRYARQVINHAVAYVDGQVHTNGMENYWALLKRGLAGTYVSVEPFHLFRYLDEQSFRYNNRKDMNDADRFSAAIYGIVGKRLTYDSLIGKESV